MRHAETLAPFLPAVINVDTDDHIGAGEPQPLDYIEADAAQPEHYAFRPGFDLCGIENGADSGRHPAADITDLVKGSILANLGDCDLGKHRKIGKRGCAHIVMQLLAIEREARRSVRHDA